jgi:hypothetical protein
VIPPVRPTAGRFEGDDSERQARGRAAGLRVLLADTPEVEWRFNYGR